MKIAQLEEGVPEIYLAVQGEGRTIGKPMVFVRCSLCNLHCTFCDTFYTWNFENTPWEHDFAPKCSISKEMMEMNPEQVAEYIKKVAGVNRSVLFTGGEPTLHQREIKKIIEILGLGWWVEIETNGTNLIDEELVHRIDQINCSPKLSNSGNDLDRAIKYDVLNQIKEAGGIFKFVIGEEKQLEEVEFLLNQLSISKEQVYLMPQGVKTQEIIDGSRWLNEICMEKGYNMSTRLQVILYDTKRAV
jgi:organic radical activating enzyme